MSAPHLIGLTGLATSGKDTVGALLRMRGYQRLAFADAVREEVYQFISQYGNTDNGLMSPPARLSYKSRCLLDRGAFKLSDVWKKPTDPDFRSLLQEWGTEYRRAQDPDYWVKSMQQNIAYLGGLSVMITDVRFPNEVELVKSNGGQIWRVERPGTPLLDHESETLQSKIVPDVTIHNSGDLQHLAQEVLTALDTPRK